MVRNDGKYTIYILQHLTRDGKEWNNSGDGSQFVKGNFRKQPLYDFCACGECWQQTGVHGTYDLEIAHRLLLLAGTQHPTRSFRICEVQICQTTTEVSRIKMSKGWTDAKMKPKGPKNTLHKG